MGGYTPALLPSETYFKVLSPQKNEKYFQGVNVTVEKGEFRSSSLLGTQVRYSPL